MSKGLKQLELHDGLDALNEDNRVTKKRRSPHQPLSAFSKTSAVILLVLTAFMVFLGLVVQQPIILILAGIELLIVGLITIGIRWAPLLGSILGGLILLVFTSATGYPLHHLTHPKDAFGYGVVPMFSFSIFIVMLVIFWSAAMLVVTGIAAVIHNYFQRERRTPPWFKVALAWSIGLLFGAFILGSLAQPTPTVVAGSSNGTPTVYLYAGSFSQSSITIAKGSKLTLIDDGSYHHNISDGTWVNGQPMFNTQSGEPVVKNQDMDATGASLVIGPFNTAGTYHIFCSLHHGMTLMIVVQ